MLGKEAFVFKRTFRNGMPIALRMARACDGFGILRESVTTQSRDNEIVDGGASYCGVEGDPPARLA